MTAHLKAREKPVKGRRRLAARALLAAAAASGAASGMLLALSALNTAGGSFASSHALLISQTLGAGVVGLAAGRRPRLLHVAALPLGLMALVVAGAAMVPGARQILLISGFMGGGALGAVLAAVLSLSSSAQHPDRRDEAAGAAWMLALLIAALAATVLPSRPEPTLSAVAAAILSMLGGGLLWTAMRIRPADEEQHSTSIVGTSTLALSPDALIFLLGAASATALMGLGGWSGQGRVALVLYAMTGVGALVGASAAAALRGRTALVTASSFASAALGFILLQGALTPPFAIAAAALLGAGLGGLPLTLLAWRARAVSPPAAFAVAALFLGQAAGVVTWMALLASPLPHGAAFVLLTTLLGLAAFASPGLVMSQKAAQNP